MAVDRWRRVPHNTDTVIHRYHCICIFTQEYIDIIVSIFCVWVGQQYERILLKTSASLQTLFIMATAQGI